ncbi:hypothetical protein BURPS1710b_A1449 [Burkholderia pseudomallei 1710b]|uniref:Uncharacterized protein n=1 Tax=Burkholderia pseudomallei (strain 1710b) TaxID=320372 RepID=Q3JIJ7_BURP1|nr:hypothetical protein BURPS1710b_A1449 [Burkholderia pseudomallei 1710b]
MPIRTPIYTSIHTRSNRDEHDRRPSPHTARARRST